MSSTRIGSRASADPPPGTVIAGYRLERVIGRGARATVYAATQVALDRRVAFKLLHDRALAARVRRLEWPEHPGAVSLFASGDSEHGPWLAMRLVAGGTLATRPAPLGQVAAALAQAHAAGIVHGDVRAQNVLVADGRAYLSDWGLAALDATAADDDAALARLGREQAAASRAQPSLPPRRSPRSVSPQPSPDASPQPSVSPQPSPDAPLPAARPTDGRRRVAVLAGAATAAAAAIVLAVALAGSGGDSGERGATARASAAATAPAPPVTAGATAVGSDLAPGPSATVDCNGDVPSGASRACGISQLALGGRAVVIPFDGTIVAWAVRAARGTLAVQVLRERDDGRFVAVDRTADALVRGPAPQRFRTDLAVAAGDRVALELTPGAAAGIRRGVEGATTERWFGPLRDVPLAPDQGRGSGFDHELLLRVDVSRDARAAG